MSQSDDHGTGHEAVASRSASAIAKQQEQLLATVRDAFGELSAQGRVASPTHSQLQQDVSTYALMLRRYRESEAPDTDWRALGPWDGGPEAVIETVLAGQVREVEDTTRHGGGTELEPAAAELPADGLVTLAMDLLDFAHDLGFAPEPDESKGAVVPDPI